MKIEETVEKTDLLQDAGHAGSRRLAGERCTDIDIAR
jgi:hypothetical protein